MEDIAEYSELQQKVITEIIGNDKGFHNAYMIADMPLYAMMDTLDNGKSTIKNNVSCSLSVGNEDYNLHIWYSKEQDCWFFCLENLGRQIGGIIHYNTVYNAYGEFALAFLNDNTDAKSITTSLPYTNVLLMRK